MLKKFCLTGLIFFLGAGFLSASITVTPSRVEISCKPGQGTKGVYAVTSRYSETANIAVKIKDWFVLPENEGIAVDKWLNVDTDVLILKPGESREIKFEVSVPSSAVGVLVGMISFSPGFKENTNVQLVISVPVYVLIEGTEKIEWQIKDCDFKFHENEFQVSCEVANSGNIHIRPKGFVKITKKNKEIAKFEFIEGRPVYPGSERAVIARYGKELEKGKYDVLVNISAFEKNREEKFKMKINKSGKLSVK
ncbi:hypothetical protein ACFL58_00595 [Elusimicrobiota bacterium]